jgi:DNA polymerase III alpha subunit (gram-positive type)
MEVQTYDEEFYHSVGSDMNETMIECNAIDINLYPCVMVLDVEASTSTRYLIQIAYNIYDMGFKLLEQRNFLINENVGEVDFFEKFSLETIQKHGCDVHKVLRKLKQDFIMCKYLVCHNIAYDCNKLLKYYEKYDIPIRLPQLICTMKLTRNVLCLKDKRGSNKNPKLSELYKYCHNEELDDTLAHSADFDVNATFKCFKKLVMDNTINLKEIH